MTEKKKRMTSTLQNLTYILFKALYVCVVIVIASCNVVVLVYIHNIASLCLFMLIIKFLHVY